MWNSVRESFKAFSVPMEGSVPHMYQDHLGKVTVGVGNLIDSAGAAWGTRLLGAPFYQDRGSGPEATEQQVKAEWAAVKNSSGVAGRHVLSRETTTLRLSEQGITNLLHGTLERFESTLRATAEFSDLESWPADAQLALLSMAWAMGPAFAQEGRWPLFRASCAQRDWLAAASNSVIANSWLAKRNAVDRGLFRSAAWVEWANADPSILKIFIPGNLPPLALGDTDTSLAHGNFDVDSPIAWLQGSLRWLGIYDGESHGNFDSATEAAVRAFQAGEASITSRGGGFTVDGKVGPLTWAAMGYLVPRS